MEAGGHGQPVTPARGVSSASLPSSEGAIVSMEVLGAIVHPNGQPGQFGEEAGGGGDAMEVTGEEPIVWKVCKFGCGGPKPESAGFARTVKCGWHCHLCYGAERTMLLMAGKGQPGQKEHLTDLRDREPEVYNAIVRSCRVVSEGKLTALEKSCAGWPPTSTSLGWSRR